MRRWRNFGSASHDRRPRRLAAPGERGQGRAEIGKAKTPRRAGFAPDQETKTMSLFPAVKMDRKAVARSRRRSGPDISNPQDALKRLYAESAPTGRKSGRQSAHSWQAVAVKLKANVGYIYNVAMGRKKASNALLIKLGLKPRDLPAPACPKCGAVHTTKKCTANKPPATFIDGSYRRMTVGEPAPDYDAWLARNTARIAAIVAWAEGER